MHPDDFDAGPNAHDFHHAKLGAITGLNRGSDIVQFCGIPYASIPARFRQSKFVTKLPQQPFTAWCPGYLRRAAINEVTVTKSEDH
jgi:hypothetical protein